MAIGRPISLTPNIATKNISSLATADQTEFTVTGGYRINEIAVYRNGVRLAQGRDFTASDGSTVDLVTAATVDDVIEFQVFDSFNVSSAIVSAASSQTLSGDLNVTGNLYAGAFNPTSIVAAAGTITRITNTDIVGTAATFNSTLHVGSALTANASGDVDTIGIITASNLFVGTGVTVYGSTGIVSATTFYGDGSNLDNVTSTTINNNADNRLISGSGTANTLNGESNLTFDGSTLAVTGAITASGAVNVDATTDSTSSTSGALIVDGGLGVAKNVYIGAGLSVAGTLTYEDVTNVDSVGLITAKSGVNVSGGQVTIGTGITMGIAGVATFSGTSDVHLLDNVKLIVGDGSDFTISHNGSNTMLEDSGTGNVVLRTNYFDVTNAGGSEDIAKFESDGPVSLYHNAIKTFTTVGTGISIYGPEGGNGQVLISADEGDDNADKFNLLVNTSGSFFLQNYASGSWANNLRAYGGGSVELMYGDGTKKFETTNDGTVTVGVCTATSFSGSGANLTNLPAAGFGTEALITAGITTVLDLSNAQDHKITVSGICTITTAGGTEGESHTIRITNSGIATVGFSSYFQFAGGASPILTKTDGAVNLVSFTVNKTATTTGITTELLTSVANNFS